MLNISSAFAEALKLLHCINRCHWLVEGRAGCEDFKELRIAAIIGRSRIGSGRK
ncbi:MAG: hypothetical protein VX646_08560 [Verrucomicrobiota bacterium]|nr:hypothetical protein [Verrucomicrobiota bacterium]